MSNTFYGSGGPVGGVCEVPPPSAGIFVHPTDPTATPLWGSPQSELHGDMIPYGTLNGVLRGIVNHKYDGIYNGNSDNPLILPVPDPNLLLTDSYKRGRPALRYLIDKEIQFLSPLCTFDQEDLDAAQEGRTVEISNQGLWAPTDKLGNRRDGLAPLILHRLRLTMQVDIGTTIPLPNVQRCDSFSFRRPLFGQYRRKNPAAVRILFH